MADLMRRLRCPECRREFVVSEDDIDEDVLVCPHCEAEVPVDNDK